MRTYNLMKPVGIAVFGLLLVPQAVSSQDQPGKADNSWLVGKWSGTPPGGGTLNMELDVKMNEITGRGRIPEGQKGPRPTITGKVEGKQVIFEYYRKGVPSPTQYHCRATEDSVLECKTTKGFETIFKKY